ncbi:folylpolyglutamate synthase/dihydrofolate synthase family protein [soil metagenome]
MTHITNFAEAEAALAEYMPLAHEIIGKDITLARMLPLMAALGNPERSLRVVHIAGTSGKTSTAYYIASLLQATGKTVGLTVSPHMDSVAERLQINLHPLSESEFCAVLQEFLEILDPTAIKPTYYELLIALAYWYFARIKVDYAVIETGLGGLHDGSNVANMENKICVITDIGYDHMQILGRTLPEITLQKAGIIHDGNEAFTYRQPDEVLEVLNKWCQAVGANLHIKDEDSLHADMDGPVLSTLPLFKRRNWLLANAVFSFIKKRDGLAGVDESTLAKSMQTYIPGRMDTVELGKKKIIMDGAHNGQKMRAFLESFQVQNPRQKAVFLLAMKQNKDYEEVLDAIKPAVSSLVATNFKVGQDRMSSGVDPAVLAKSAEQRGFIQVSVISDLNAAYRYALSLTPRGGLLVVTGSLYLLSQLRHEHRELRHA